MLTGLVELDSWFHCGQCKTTLFLKGEEGFELFFTENAGTCPKCSTKVEVYLDGRSLVEVALHLAESPCSPLKMESPGSATLARFDHVGADRNKPMLRLVKG